MITELLLSGAVGVVTSAATAFITSKIQLRRESAAWRREFALKFAELSAKPDKGPAQALAQQVGIGVIIFEGSEGREKHFVPPGCRMVVGRDASCDIAIHSRELSRKHFAITADDGNVYVQDLGSANGVLVNGVRVTGTRKLVSGELIQVGMLSFEFWPRWTVKIRH